MLDKQMGMLRAAFPSWLTNVCLMTFKSGLLLNFAPIGEKLEPVHIGGVLAVLFAFAIFAFGKTTLQLFRPSFKAYS